MIKILATKCKFIPYGYCFRAPDLILLSRFIQSEATQSTRSSTNQNKQSLSYISDTNSYYSEKKSHENEIKIRLNRCLRPLTRKLADSAIFEGKVTVNGKIASVGMKITRNDKVKVNNLEIDVTVPAYNQLMSPFDIEEIRILGENIATSESMRMTKKPIYIKFWKPSGYNPTLKKNAPHNLIEFLKRDLHPNVINQLYCIGGMAPSISGIILLTNDRRLVDVIKAGQMPVESIFHVSTVLNDDSESESESKNENENENEISYDQDDDTHNEEQEEQNQQQNPVQDVDAMDNEENISMPWNRDESRLQKSENNMIVHSFMMENQDEYSITMVEKGMVSHKNVIRRHLKKSAGNCHRISYAGIDLTDLPSKGYSRYFNQKELDRIKVILETHGKLTKKE